MANLDFYYPFDSVSGDRKITAATERRFWAELFGDGIVSADGFRLSTTATAGSFRIGAGVAIVGGCIGGTTAKYNITARPAAGTSGYIVIRTDTNNAVRKMTLEFVTALQSATQAQLAEGGKRDLPLYKVTANTAGNAYTVTDLRKWANSFDKSEFSAQFDAMVASVRAQAETAFDAQAARFEAAIDAANAENAGMYGAAGRQGFINPTFAVNQRGKDVYSIKSGSAYTFDRWKALVDRATLPTAMTFETVQDGARHALKVGAKAFSSATTMGRAGFVQNIEGGVRTFAAGGRKFTISFDVKADAACKVGIDVNQIPATGAAGVFIARSVDVGTEWQRVSVTFTGSATPTAAQKTDVLQVGFFVSFKGFSRYSADQSADNNVYFANMQINEGTGALSCYARDYAEELERCQRYYVAFGPVSLSCGATLATNKQIVTGPLPLARRMYRYPDATFTDRANVAGCASIELAEGGLRGGLSCAMSDLSQDHPVFVVNNTDSGAATRVCFNSMELDAEIMD